MRRAKVIEGWRVIPWYRRLWYWIRYQFHKSDYNACLLKYGVPPYDERDLQKIKDKWRTNINFMKESRDEGITKTTDA